MSDPHARWGIGMESTWEWEEDRLQRSRNNPTQVPDETTSKETMLVDTRGRPLIVKEPRKVGFRPPR